MTSDEVLFPAVMVATFSANTPQLICCWYPDAGE